MNLHSYRHNYVDTFMTTHIVGIDNVSVIVTYIYTCTNIRKLNGTVVAEILTFVS